MKKLSILIALCLLVTVGGVYATWSYAGQEVAPVENTNTEIQIADVSNTNKGTITVTNNVSLTIDDAKFLDAGATAYQAVFSASGDLTITFTPNAIASADVQSQGIRMKATLSLTGVSDNVISVKTAEILVNGGTACKTYTFTAEQVASWLQINGVGGDSILNTYEEYQTFKTALGTPTLTITISEITTP